MSAIEPWGQVKVLIVAQTDPQLILFSKPGSKWKAHASPEKEDAKTNLCEMLRLVACINA